MTSDERWLLIDLLLMGVIAGVLVFYVLGDWQLWARFLAAFWLARVSSIVLGKLSS